LIYGSPSETDLASTIWTNKPAGIPSYGTSIASYVDDLGETRTVLYSTVTQVPINIWVTLAVSSTYVGDLTFATDLCTEMQLRALPGGTVYLGRVSATAYAEGGVLDVTSTEISTSGTPGSSNIAIDPRSVATFDPSDVAVVIA